MTFPYPKICDSLIRDLDTRTRDVLLQRFGLVEDKAKTLEAIGQNYGITRERVRQIAEDGLSEVRKRTQKGSEQQKVQEIYRHFSGILKEAGDLKRQDMFVAETGSAHAANHVVFLLHLGDQFHGQRETEHFYPFWAGRREVLDRVVPVLDEILEYFEKGQEPVPFEEVGRRFLHRFGSPRDGGFGLRTLLSLLEVSKYIEQGYNGKWGLRSWPEVYPRGMRDKAYVVLKETGKPLHFVQVAEGIGKFQEQGALRGLTPKKVLPQTVHNELIKDSRFVLVGRGTYALSEWGYAPGTVKDIIVHILEQNGSSMEKQEIVTKTLEQRQVKESTILLNLQDRNYFLRDPEGRYHLTST